MVGVWPCLRRGVAAAFFLVLVMFALASPRNKVWITLSSFPLISAEQGWGTLGVDRSVQGHPLALGKTRVNGYGTHAPGQIVFDLDGRCESFRVHLDLDREVAYTKAGSVDFSIIGDGRKLFDSGVLRVTDQRLPLPVTVDVRGVKVLELVSGDAGDGVNSDHADWLSPEVSLAVSDLPLVAERYRIVQANGISLQISRSGQVTGLKQLGESIFHPFHASTRLLGESLMGTPLMRRLPGGGIETVRRVKVGVNRAHITERFEPSDNSIRWQCDVASEGPAWSTPITTQLRFGRPETRRVWMPWNDPIDTHASLGIGDAETPWNDPLIAQPFRNRLLSYGENPNTNWWTGDVVSLPMVSELDPGSNRGITFIQSPNDPLPAAQISAGETGWIAFNRLNRRLGEGKSARFTMFIVAHSAEPKIALASFVHRFPAYFESPNPAVSAFSGCGAYSGDERNLEPEAAVKLRHMDFKSMWKLSDDYAYMGMFIPPVKDPDERWQRIDDSGSPPNYKPIWTSVKRLNDYGKMLRSNGFHLLSYFNTIEFGHDNKGVPNPVAPDAPDIWKDPSQYLKVKAPQAPLRPDGTYPEGAWQGGWAMDLGDPGYQSHLLEQADRHIRWLPDSEGICIDRVDYMCQYNDLADDGVTFHNKRRSRALVSSWRNLMDLLGPKMHQAGKVIFANLMDPRLDLAKHLDGVYAEFGNQPTVVNGLSFLCLNKPLLAWTRNEDKLSDAFFQRHLYLGAFPTAPYPTNNHCIQPSAGHDKWYMDYGPLFTALNGRKWVLEPHLATVKQATKVNLFAVPGGYAVSITFAGKSSSVQLSIGKLRGLSKHTRFEAILPGSSISIRLVPRNQKGVVSIRVPIVRGCGIVRVRI